MIKLGRVDRGKYDMLPRNYFFFLFPTFKLNEHWLMGKVDLTHPKKNSFIFAFHTRKQKKQKTKKW